MLRDVAPLCCVLLQELVQLLHDLRPLRRCGDKVFFIGDVISKGPAPLAALRLARAVVEAFGGEMLAGNHERAFLHFITSEFAPSAGVPAPDPEDGLKTDGASEALFRRMNVSELVRQGPITVSEVAWLHARPYHLALPELNVWLVHAGVRADVPLDAQLPTDLTSMRSLDANGTDITCETHE